MSKIILGTAQFGLKYGINNKIGKPNYKQIESIFDYAFNNNINFLDTAEAYGESHNIIGKYHFNSKNKFEVTTKFSEDRSDLPKKISDRIIYHLKTMNIDNIYCYMFHKYDDFKKYFNSFKSELLELKNRGIIKKIGVSLHSNSEIDDVLKYKNIELIQVPYNLLDNKLKRNQIFLKAKKSGVEVHTRSTFLQGLFFKDLDKINGKLSSLKQYLRVIKRLVHKNEINDLAINYVYSNTNISGVLIGVDSIMQLKKNISCINNLTYNDIMNKIDNINVYEEDLLNPVNW